MPRLITVSAAALLALLAGTAQAQTYWQGGANAAGAAIINVPSITVGKGAKRTAVLSLVLPASAKINGVSASMLVIKHEYDCAARTIRAVSGEAFDDTGKPIVELPMQKTAQRIDADSANALNLGVVCAPTPQARAQFGAPLGDDFNAILHKLRGEPVPVPAPPPAAEPTSPPEAPRPAEPSLPLPEQPAPVAEPAPAPPAPEPAPPPETSPALDQSPPASPPPEPAPSPPTVEQPAPEPPPPGAEPPPAKAPPPPPQEAPAEPKL